LLSGLEAADLIAMDAAPNIPPQAKPTPSATDIDAERVRLLFKQALPILLLSARTTTCLRSY
jgi:hypothetical protein